MVSVDSYNATVPRQYINFQPQKGPQTDFLTCPISDILFGGARGGGKTYAIIGHFLSKAADTYTRLKKDRVFTGILVRKGYPDLEHAISQAHKIYAGIAEWRQNKTTFVFPEGPPYGGAQLKFRYLDKQYKHSGKFIGHEYQWIGVEEAGDFADPSTINALRATSRSSDGARRYFVMSANPGGPGHNWIKAEYIDPAPPNTPFYIAGSMKQRIYIPSRVQDNKILMQNDPTYIEELKVACEGKPWLLRAWLEGDWNIVAGGMFDDLWNPTIHEMDPFIIPKSWPIYRSFDWGSAKPFSVGWWAISDGTSAILSTGDSKTYPRGTLFRIDEWYGCSDKNNIGLRMGDREIAKEIRRREFSRGWNVLSGPADTSIFEEINNTCLADYYKEYGIFWKKADKSPGSRVTGWQEMRDLMRASLQFPMEYSGLFVFNHCRDFIRTVPTAPRDSNKVDDIDTNAEDHILDETRYMIGFKPSGGSRIRMRT